MDTTLKYPWQQTVVDAFMELRPERIPEKIKVAERAIFERLDSLQQVDIDERASLRDALNILHVVFTSAEAADKRNAAHVGARFFYLALGLFLSI